MSDPLNINKLFQDILKEEVFTEEQSNIQLKEQERLQNLHNLDKDNIDDIFDNLIDSNHINDLYIGEKFNKWTVLKFSKFGKYKSKLYEVQCDCGTISISRIDDIIRGRSTKCKNCRGASNRELLKGVTKKRIAKATFNIGEIINNRMIIDYAENDKNSRIRAVVKCLNCQRDKIVRLADLKRSNSQHCDLCRTAKPLHSYEYNNKYGDKNIIGIELHENIKGRAILLWKCDKNHNGKTALSDLRNGRDEYCRICYLDMLQDKLMDGIVVGSIFGNRTVIDITEAYKKFGIRRTRSVLTKCKCGKEKLVEIYLLKTGKANNCPQCGFKNQFSNKKE